MFQIKNFNSIVLAMLNNAKATQDEITDWNVGSAARTLIEAPAVEIEELYQRMLYGILDAIPVAIYHAFNFGYTNATVARGTITLDFSQPIVAAFVIPSGTVFKNPTSGVSYLSQFDVAVSQGAYSVDIVAIADRLGTAGNTDINTITQVLGAYVPNTTSLSNAIFVSGADAETDEHRTARFSEFIGSLARGTPAAVMYAVKQAIVTDDAGRTIETVARATLSETPGRARIYIYGSSGVPSMLLLNAAQLLIDGVNTNGQYSAGYTPVGVSVRVLPMVQLPIVVPLIITAVGDTNALHDAIASKISLLFERTASGVTLNISEIIDVALSVTGVQKVIAELNENVVIANNEVITLSSLQVTRA
jgi:uncharacterized phage protein gp47/JayE